MFTRGSTRKLLAAAARMRCWQNGCLSVCLSAPLEHRFIAQVESHWNRATPSSAFTQHSHAHARTNSRRLPVCACVYSWISPTGDRNILLLWSLESYCCGQQIILSHYILTFFWILTIQIRALGLFHTFQVFKTFSIHLELITKWGWLSPKPYSVINPTIV